MIPKPLRVPRDAKWTVGGPAEGVVLPPTYKKVSRVLIRPTQPRGPLHSIDFPPLQGDDGSAPPYRNVSISACPPEGSHQLRMVGVKACSTDTVQSPVEPLRARPAGQRPKVHGRIRTWIPEPTDPQPLRVNCMPHDADWAVKCPAEEYVFPDIRTKVPSVVSRPTKPRRPLGPMNFPPVQGDDGGAPAYRDISISARPPKESHQLRTVGVKVWSREGDQSPLEPLRARPEDQRPAFDRRPHPPTGLSRHFKSVKLPETTADFMVGCPVQDRRPHPPTELRKLHPPFALSRHYRSIKVPNKAEFLVEGLAVAPV